MTAPAFLFDLDGTLVDSLPDIAATANHVRVQHGLDAVDDTTARRYVGDGVHRLLERALRDLLPADAEQRAAFLATAFDIYSEHHVSQCTRLVQLFDGAQAVVEGLHARGHALAIVTNKPERFAAPIAQHLGLDRWFSVIVGGDTLPQKKPDPAPLRHALEQLEHTGDVVMVGDGLQDVRAGKALGAHTIACLFGYADADALRAEGADEYWSSFGAPTQ